MEVGKFGRMGVREFGSLGVWRLGVCFKASRYLCLAT